MKVTSDLGHTNDLVRTLSEQCKKMQSEKANVVQLEALQEEVSELIRDANGSVAVLKRTMGTVVNDVKEHFKTATNTVANQNAHMLSEVRVSYQDELNQVAKMRGDIVKFMQETQNNTDRLQETVVRSQDETHDVVSKARTEIEELGSSRLRDKSNADLDRKTLHDHLATVTGSSESVAKWLEHVCSIMWTMLQGEAASSALDLQDGRDRSKVALMGFPEPKDEPASAKRPSTSTSTRPSTGAPSSRPGTRDTARADSTSRPGTRGRGRGGLMGTACQPSAETDEGPVISLDNRCLSCSGHGQTVLSGFKMACLQYTPSPVAFANKTHNRMELLELRQKLLDQAVDALRHGPIPFAEKDVDLSAIKDAAGAGSKDAASTAMQLPRLFDSETPLGDSLQDPLGSRSSSISFSSTCPPGVASLPLVSARR